MATGKALQSLQDFANARKALPEVKIFDNPKTKRQRFINQMAKDIILSTIGTKLFPSVDMAQMICETGDGDTIMVAANNAYGVKATKSWNGKVVSNTTSEYIKDNTGKKVKQIYKGTGLTYNSYSEAIKQGANYVTLFRVYNDVIDSIKDHNGLIINSDRYNDAENALTPEIQAEELEQHGYSTSDQYGETLASIIHASGLKKLDELKEQFEKILNND